MKQFLWVFDTYSTEVELSEFKKLVARHFKDLKEFHNVAQKFLKENKIENNLFDEIYTIENFSVAFNDSYISDQYNVFAINVGESNSTQYQGTINISL